MGWVRRGSAYTMLANETTAMYSMPSEINMLTAWHSRSACSTEHPPGDLVLHLFIGPIGMCIAQMAGNDQSSGPIAIECGR